MIETEEQYDEIRDVSYQDQSDGIWICEECDKPLGETDHCGSCQVALLQETIEALREVARGSKKLLKLLELSGFPRGDEERDLDGILGALPNWITNE